MGERFTARFPLQPREVDAARGWLEREAEAARELLGRTRFPTPEPVAIGEPGASYPLPWSVQTWVPGVVATDQDPGDSFAFAHDLAEFVSGVLEREPRQALRQQLDCDDLEWERGKAWAFQQAMRTVWYYHQTNPAMSRMGRRTLARIMADPPSA
jgi:aminoglycoside phosphotransferase (APT) family kinase protein